VFPLPLLSWRNQKQSFFFSPINRPSPTPSISTTPRFYAFTNFDPLLPTAIQVQPIPVSQTMNGSPRTVVFEGSCDLFSALRSRFPNHDVVYIGQEPPPISYNVYPVEVRTTRCVADTILYTLVLTLCPVEQINGFYHGSWVRLRVSHINRNGSLTAMSAPMYCSPMALPTQRQGPERPTTMLSRPGMNPTVFIRSESIDRITEVQIQAVDFLHGNWGDLDALFWRPEHTKDP
jgi:hypothetical protein